jgi:hypothetical protein
MAYELFQNKTTKMVPPALTISAQGRVVLNAEATAALVEAGGKFVHFLWDSKAVKIALCPLPKADKFAFKITPKKGRRGATISANTFLHHIGWAATKPTTLDARWNADCKLLEATLPPKCLKERTT